MANEVSFVVSSFCVWYALTPPLPPAAACLAACQHLCRAALPTCCAGTMLVVEWCWACCMVGSTMRCATHFPRALPREAVVAAARTYLPQKLPRYTCAARTAGHLPALAPRATAAWCIRAAYLYAAATLSREEREGVGDCNPALVIDCGGHQAVSILPTRGGRRMGRRCVSGEGVKNLHLYTTCLRMHIRIYTT